MAVLVADGATMRHLTDDVRVADGFQAIGSDHIAIKIHTFELVLVIALRDGENTAQEQHHYKQQPFHPFTFWLAKIQQIMNGQTCFLLFSAEICFPFQI
jgi:hypothetical protein